VSSRRRLKLSRRLKRAFAQYLRDGDEATEAVEIIARAAAARGSAWPPGPQRGRRQP
jgi:hypothetical protein